MTTLLLVAVVFLVLVAVAVVVVVRAMGNPEDMQHPPLPPYDPDDDEVGG